MRRAQRDALETYIEQNGAAFADRPDLFDAATARKLTVDARLAFAIVRPVLLKRGEAGFARRCHGDLHLRNIVLIDGEPTLFDAVEFSDAIASGDVLYDLAFLLMDLEERGLRAAANRLFNRYLAPEPPEAMTGLAALPLFLSLRAAIRAKVEASGAERLEGEKRNEARALSRRYFDWAVEFLRYAPPRLVAVGGLSGVRQKRARRRARAAARPGAWRALAAQRRRAQGDVRSRGDRPSARPPPTHPRSPATSIGGSSTKPGSRCGPGRRSCSTRPSRRLQERAAAAGAAAEVGVAFAGLFLEAPLSTRLERIASRRADASDADADVASRQTAEPLGERGWAALDAAGNLGQTTSLALARLGNA